MEEQPIDNLFKRKLREAEMAPSDAAWEALQEKRGQKRLVPVWNYMAIAASLVLVCSIGWWSLRKENVTGAIAKTKSLVPTTKPQFSNEETVAQSIKPKAQLNYKHKLSRDIEKIPLLEMRMVKAEKRNKTLQSEPDVNLKNKNVAGATDASVAKQAEVTQTNVKAIATIETLPELAISKETAVHAAERILVVSIDLPTSTKAIPIELATKADTSVHKSGLGNLLKKVRRFKDGEVLALGNTGAGKVNRKGLGKLYEDVKESIKNNSAE